jgi:hypothetical protein
LGQAPHAGPGPGWLGGRQPDARVHSAPELYLRRPIRNVVTAARAKKAAAPTAPSATGQRKLETRLVGRPVTKAAGTAVKRKSFVSPPNTSIG